MTARRVTGGSVYVGLTAAAAAVAAWPVYASAQFVVLAAVASVAGAGIAALAFWRRWGPWAAAGLLAAVFAVLAVPLAVPTRSGGPVEFVRGLGEAAAGLLLGWKDLVTVELPVGAYRNLLVPALVVFLVGTTVALLLSWRADRWAIAAVPVGFAMLGFGLFFGRSDVSGPWRLGWATLAAPVETLLGAVGMLAALLWLAWRTHDERVRALHRAAAASGVRVSRRPSRADRRRTALGATMVVVALAVAVAVVPWAARGADRDVLRSAAGPQRDIAAAISPLSQYRALFSPERSDEVLFAVSGDAALPERVRIATLDVYDGETYRAGGEADDPTPFVRVPSTRDAGVGTPVDVGIEIDGLEGIWMPTVGQVASVDFAGPRAGALADRFYYSAEAQAAVQTADGGLAPGDAYRLRAVEPPVPDLGGIEPPGGGAASVEAPDNLRRWVEEHVSGTGGAALAGLVALLRERGYLSHALAIDETAPPAWLEELGPYSFQPSTAGHSLARIDAMFQRLLERESDPRAAASGNYVAAVGDDEQFAVATALIAGELGFPARVVLGARLGSADPGVSTCDGGVCRGQDLTAWTEVLSDDGAWVPIDVTPQWTQSPSLEVTEQRDPENVTEVRPDSVEEVVPPEPMQEDTARDEDETAEGWDLSWLWPILRAAGIVLLILLVLVGPFLTVVAAKALRRRARRRAEDPVRRIAGGWEEYVDAGTDAGRDVPRAATRSELAAALGTPQGATLATAADRAVFSAAAVTADDAEEFWRIVETERRTLTRGRSLRHSILAAVSLRSFARIVAPQASQRVSRIVGRGRRRAARGGRTTS